MEIERSPCGHGVRLERKGGGREGTQRSKNVKR